MPVIRSPRNLCAGLLYLAVGGAAVLLARDYGMGSGSRMGPAYFPTVLGSLLAFIGVAAIVRGFLTDGAPVGAVAWKGMLLVGGGTLLFGVLLRPAGLIPAVTTLILVSAAASVKFRLDYRAIGLMLLLVAFCALVFVKGLGLQVSLFGPR